MAGRKLASIANVERLSPLVTRVLGQNAGPKRLQGTNTYLVGRGPEVVLIDTGDPDNTDYLSLLSDTLQTLSLSLSSIILTHYHIDHVGGCMGVLDLIKQHIPVYKYPHSTDPHIGTSPYFSGVTPVTEQDTVSVPGASLRVYHTPGHSSDSISLYLEEEGTLFCGDSVLGGSSGDYSNYHLYMQTLDRYNTIAPEALYTGHGVVEQLEVVSRYIAHRRHREEMVLSALRAQPAPISTADLTLAVYKDDGIVDIPALLWSANRIVGLYLEKFVIDNSVVEVSPDMWQSRDLDTVL